MNDLTQTLGTAAAVVLVGLVVTALWRLGSVLVGLPAALEGIRVICSEHDERLTRLENIRMNGATA